MGEQQRIDKPLRELMEIIHFTEDVSAKIHGLLDEAEIYSTVREEFARSKRYNASIVLLTDDGSQLRIAETSLPPEQLKAWAKRTGLSVEEFQIDLDKSSIYSQVVREGKTLCVNVGDVIGELFPRPLARLISKITGYEKEFSILTPLKRHGKIIGAFAMTSPELSEHFIPSVRNLARHISAALELADEYAQRKRAEEALRRQRDELAARSAILSATLRTTDLDELLGLILDEVVAFLGTECASIHLVHDEQVVLRAWRGLSAAFRAQVLSFPADDPPDWLREARVVHEHLNDVDVTPEFAKGEGIQAWASVPLRLPPKEGREEKWLGTLIVGSRRYEALNEDSVRGLQVMSDQLALAIDHARSYREAQERLARLQTLREIDRAIIQQLDLREVLHVVLERVPKELGADAAAISLLDEEQLRPEVFVMHLPNGAFVEEEVFELAESLLHWFVERQEPVTIYDLTQDPRVQVHRERIRDDGLISYLGVPLVVHDKTIGILHLMTTQPRVFANEDVAFFRTMAGQAAIAIENARLYEAVRQELAVRIEAEGRYRSLFDRVPVGLYRSTPEGQILDVNPAFVGMLGYPDRESLLAVNAVSLYVDAEDRRRWQALIHREGVVRDFEVQWRRRNGTVIWVRDSARGVRDASDRVLYYEGTVEDITERKRAEERIVWQRAVLAAVNKVLQEALTCETDEEVARTCLAVAEELTGSKFGFIGEVNQAGLFDTIAISNPGWDACKMPESDATVLTKNMEIRGIDRSVLREGKSRIVNDPASHPDRVGTPEGHPPITCFLGVPLKQAGRTIGMIGLANKESGYDLADQQAIEALAVAFVEALHHKRAEVELRGSQQLLEKTFASLRDAVFIIDADTTEIVDCNSAASETFGYSRQEMLGRTTAFLHVDEAAMEEFREHLYPAVEEKGFLFLPEFRMKRKDGTIFPTEHSVVPIEDERGKRIGWVSVVRDITERVRVERLLRALNQAALAMEQALTPEEIFATVAEELKKLGFSCMVLLTDESRSRLFPTYLSYDARVIKAAEKLTGLKTEEFSISVEATNVYKEVVWERKAVFVENAEDVVRQVLPGPAKRFSRRIVKMLKIPKSISSPLIVEDDVMGIFTVQSDDLTAEDVPAITAFAHQVAAAWRKAQLLQDLEKSLAEVKQTQEQLRQSFERLQRTLEGTISVLASAVEMRDPYTAGHQRRVTELACAIAKEMGLPEEQIEGLRMAGLIHDLGKMSVPAEILSKPSALSDLEYGLIKMHPQTGFDVLDGATEFPWPVAQIVLQHHERLDGSGYPQGLSGGEIVLEARILAVADVVEAMASHRPYRPAQGIDKALEEISQNRGVLYDPEVVDVCLKLFTEKGFELE